MITSQLYYHCTKQAFMEIPARIELATHGFSVHRSTNWAIEPLVAREGFEPTTSGLWARRATRLLYLAMLLFLSYHIKCSNPSSNLISFNRNGGGTGIRTQAPVSWPTGFQDRTLQPLGYSSIILNSFSLLIGWPSRTWTYDLMLNRHLL